MAHLQDLMSQAHKYRILEEIELATGRRRRCHLEVINQNALHRDIEHCP